MLHLQSRKIQHQTKGTTGQHAALGLLAMAESSMQQTKTKPAKSPELEHPNANVTRFIRPDATFPNSKQPLQPINMYAR